MPRVVGYLGENAIFT